MQKNAYPFCGTIVHEDDVANNQVSYRFHLADPIRFDKRIRVCLESGHADHLRDDWCTTAYWYQTLPGPKLELPPVAQRIPRKATIPIDGIFEPDLAQMTKPQRDAVEARAIRLEKYLADRKVLIDRRADDSQARSRRNVELAKEVRDRWLRSLAK